MPGGICDTPVLSPPKPDFPRRVAGKYNPVLLKVFHMPLRSREPCWRMCCIEVIGGCVIGARWSSKRMDKLREAARVTMAMLHGSQLQTLCEPTAHRHLSNPSYRSYKVRRHYASCIAAVCFLTFFAVFLAMPCLACNALGVSSQGLID